MSARPCDISSGKITLSLFAQMITNFTISRDFGANGKTPRHLELLDLKLYSLTTNITMTGHTRGGMRPMPMRQGSLNDHSRRSHLDPHLRPLDPGGMGLRSLRYDTKVTS